MSETILSNIYYIPKGYWKGLAAIQKLAEAGNVSEKVDRNWLRKQALWHVYLPAPRHIPRPKFDVPTLNKVHQAELLFFGTRHSRWRAEPQNLQIRFNGLDVARRYTSKEATKIAGALRRIYKSTLGASSWVLSPNV